MIEKETLDKLMPQISSQRDVKKSLDAIFRFFKRFFPLDLLMMGVYTKGEDSLRFLALINDEGVMLIDKLIPLSKAGLKQVEKAVVKRITHLASGEGDVGRDIGTHLGLTLEHHCSLALSVKTSPFKYAHLILSTMEDQEYEQKHIDAFTGLSEPLSNLVHRLYPQIEVTVLRARLTIEDRELRRKFGFLGGEQIIGAKSGLKAVMEQIELIAPRETPVLISGETGAGKEVVASAIQRRSSRTHKPFISINCGAIPDTLMDSELFGSEKGAFTGAIGTRQGYFEQADGGTIFLDEIAELSPPAQVKLLRVLQTMTLNRVGGSRSIPIDVRVIAATNRDIPTMITENKFRQDLWFRINVFPIVIPPLRDRREDIPLFAEYFTRRISSEMNLSFVPKFAEGAMDQLQVYHWPGNVRELRNIIERTLILSKGRPMLFPNLLSVPDEYGADTYHTSESKILTLDELVAQHIRTCLTLSKGQVAGAGGAAELLGLHPSTLRGKMRRLGIRIKHLPAH